MVKFTRRVIVCAIAAAANLGNSASAAPPSKPVAINALGANYNENFEDFVPRELDAAGAGWVRMFQAMPQVGRQGAKAGAIRTILAADAQGYSTILSLKFPFTDEAFPQPGDARWQRELAQLDTVLEAVMGKIDILVIGNEPFIESRERDRDATLNAFYEAMAKRAIAYRAAHCPVSCRTRLYMGALNRLDLPKNRSKAAVRWLDFVRETPELDGVDIHPHIPSLEASKPFLDFVLPRLRPDQTFIVTEFSLVHYWRMHNRDPISPAFAAKHGMSRDVRVWQVIDAALKTPFPQDVWSDFLGSEPWFASRRFYLRNQMEMFRLTGKLAVATYGFRQGIGMTRGGFKEDRMPWLLNSVFAPATVQLQADGLPGRNPYWFEQFKALQRPAGAKP